MQILREFIGFLYEKLLIYLIITKIRLSSNVAFAGIKFETSPPPKLARETRLINPVKVKVVTTVSDLTLPEKVRHLVTSGELFFIYDLTNWNFWNCSTVSNHAGFVN